MYSITNPQKNAKSQPITKKTLDVQHTLKMQQFQDKELMVASLNEQLQCLKEKYDHLLQQKNTSEMTDDFIDEIVTVQDEIMNIEKQLSNIDNEIDEIDYLINTSDILFKYYDIIDKGSAQDDPMIVNKTKVENSILKYLMKPENESEKQENQVQDNMNDRASLLEKYLACTEHNYVKNAEMEIKDRCPFCDSSNRNIMLNDGLIYCNDCHIVEYIIIDHDRPSYKDPPKEISYFAYKRINHFNEWISQIQGKETTDIPEEVYDKILLEIKKQKITNMAELTCSKVKEILKKLKINKYYEHVPHIINKLNGLPTPHFDPELEDKLRSMFKQIQPLFLKYAPGHRKNFLSYSYVLHKFVQLLGKDEYLPYFSLLKSREKLHQQDQIWKKICDELSWEFIRSI